MSKFLLFFSFSHCFKMPTIPAISPEWTRNELEEKHFEYLRKLPDVLDAKEFSITHASNCRAPRWTYVLDNISARSNFDHQAHRICFNGHTHIPLIIFEDPHGKIDIMNFKDVTLDSDMRYLINVGSVGQPRDRRAEACTATYDTESRELKIHRLPYDIKKIQDIKIERETHRETEA